MIIKVAVVLPDFSYGGAQVMVSRLASHLNCESVETEIICIYGEAKHNDLEQAILDHGIKIRYLGKGLGFSAAAMMSLFRELDLFNPDIVHTHLSGCVYSAPWVIMRHRKMLHTVHNIPGYELIWPKRVLMRMLYKTGHAVPVAISKEIRILTKSFYHLKQDPELIYNPVDVARFATPKKKETNAFVILSVGRLSAQKNQQLLIRTFSRLHKKNERTELYILGDGSLRGELEQLALKEGVNESVHFEGSVTNTQDYYAKADVFAMSSEYEGLPLVILEAMAASLPIVSTDVGGVKDLVSENGLLVQAGNCKQMTEALNLLMQDSDKREMMGKQSFEKVQQYDSSVIANRYTNLYVRYAANSGEV